jgi:hypothetical protein
LADWICKLSVQPLPHPSNPQPYHREKWEEPKGMYILFFRAWNVRHTDRETEEGKTYSCH